MTKEEIEEQRARIRKAEHLYDIIDLEKHSYAVLKDFGNKAEAKITFSGYDKEGKLRDIAEILVVEGYMPNIMEWIEKYIAMLEKEVELI